MPEEKFNDNFEPVVKETDVQKEPPSAAKAREGGWVPKKEWEEAGKDADDWVDAPEFNRRGELMTRITSQTSQLRDLQKTTKELAEDRERLTKALKVLGEHNKKIAETEYKNALRDLRTQRAEALREGEDSVVAELEDQIDELKEAKTEAGKTDVLETKESPSEDPVNAELAEYYQTWIKDPDNQWYEKDLAMRATADALAEQALATGKVSVPELFENVTSEIKKEFAHKFQTKRPAPTVTEPEGGRKDRSSSTQKFSAKDLSPEQLDVAKTFTESGAISSIQEYVDQLAAIGGIGSE